MMFNITLNLSFVKSRSVWDKIYDSFYFQQTNNTF